MLRVGIVGLPNVGKSTLFKTLTKKQVPCENFPFCTIEPNVGVVEVPDNRLKQLADVSKSERIIPTAIEFVDIAGLVKGAHKGEGLGNKFLANIREVDMIAHVVRSFNDTNVHHVDGSVNPLRDAETIEIELAMADLETISKRLDATKAKMKAGKTKELEKELNLFEKIYAVLEQGKMARTLSLDEEEQNTIKSLHLLTYKPILYVLNIDEKEIQSDQRAVLGLSRQILSLSIKVESEIIEMEEQEQKEFLSALGISCSGLDRLITKCYELLNLMTFLTSGEKETRAWTVPKGTKAPQAAGVIHTDFEKGFIRVEIIHWEDFVALGESGAKEAGKMRIEGKDYVMQDGDVCYFRVST
ncbi:redox-regulated ATPase YchF [Candidatus Uhrbacteria bacterium CG_4_9_14_3_um_filter_36_7]|uniref:Ribosome-binding ATPase YchF n=1 Tax=Candidatus Uhrbacteria bacterium CG_4_9_14_3_um_filter_36_7 TaxID=1975033 RepID=A0A2M7XHX9_9BACT|nr:MAG: redox-regulated ATPase YchF [Candidatus Uhrbacteria bacterium CG_4_9_14_3_um_filter_36_7]